MLDQLGNLEDHHLELIARITGWVNTAIDGYQRARAWALGNAALVAALVVLAAAVLLRYLGWL